MDDMPIPWVAALDGRQVVAVQHGCGQDGQPVNCHLDEHNNWKCPNCYDTYGAAVPLEGWGAVAGVPDETARRLCESLWSKLARRSDGTWHILLTQGDLDALRELVYPVGNTA